MCGYRIGEASHPGPSRQNKLTAYFGSDPKAVPPPVPPTRDTCVVAVINPTSVLHKVPLFLETEADVLALAETSAVEHTQQVTGRALSRHNFRAHWGRAVPCHRRDGAPQHCLRGLAAGVALFSRLPSRASRPPLPEAALETCRLSEAFVRFGALEVRMLTVYCWPLSHLDAPERNEHLLSMALQRATSSAVPCIVAGDFNQPLQQLPSGQAFAALGYQDIFTLHRGTTGSDLPATCKGSTRNDTALLHPVLLPLWVSAWVLSDKQLFDAHDPLCFRMRLCSARPCPQVWDLPRPWTGLGVTKQDFEDAFQPHCPKLLQQAQACASVDDVAKALLDFSVACETAVDTAVRLKHQQDPVRFPAPHLTRHYRGRCADRKTLKRELPSIARPDRQGGYTPDEEVTSVLGRLKVRQVRRVATLYKGLVKYHREGATSTSLRSQLLREWRAIDRAKGYAPSFAVWVLNIASFTSYPFDLPDLDWLSDLKQYLAFDCDGLAAQQSKERKVKFQYHVQLDCLQGHSKQGFQALRPPPHPPFQEVPCTKEAKVHTAQAVPDCPLQSKSFQLEARCCLRVPGPAKLAECHCQLLEQQGDQIRVSGAELPESGLLSQAYVATTTEELHEAFADFWGPLWQRDAGSPSLCLDEWPALSSRLLADDLPVPDLQLRSFAPDLWQTAIKRMSAHKATGVCGWSPRHLKLLSYQAIEVLNHIFHQAVTCGLPPRLMLARVAVLAKAAQPDSMRQSRPITIFSVLYRLWSSVLTRQVLGKWVAFFPRAVSGSMPGRACRDTSYRQQHSIECSILDGTPLLGCSIDIVKCFNQLAWPIVAALLIRLGVPEPETRFWVSCIRAHRRCTTFHGSLTDGIVSHSGAPEGDPFSVAAMAAVCFWADRWCHHDAVSFDSYVDNWSWSSESRQGLCHVLPAALAFLQDMALPVDIRKSYLWATQRADRVWLKAHAARLFPELPPPDSVTEVRDLGVAFKFDARAHASHRNCRLRDGLERLGRLQQQPRPALNKAHLVQASVWPACLFGSEGHVHTAGEFQKLRGAAARAIVGPYKVLSPHLTLTALASKVMDPELYCLYQKLVAFKRCCQHDPDTAMSILLRALQPRHKKTAHGPATALSLALHRCGLTLTEDAGLKGLDNTRVQLSQCSSSAVKDLLLRSWAIQTLDHTRHRNGLHQQAPVLSSVTVALLANHKPAAQAVLLRHVAGAFSSEAAKALWDPDSEGNCPLCGERQTKAHKVLYCPKLADIRAAWWPFVGPAFERWPEWVHCPAASYPTDLEISQLVFHTRGLPTPSVNWSAWPDAKDRGFLRLFTDGSCTNPDLPLASRASFAVILDTTSSDVEVPGLLNEWRQTKLAPAQLTVICQGLVPGQQSINRAEVCAVIQALRAAASSGCRHIEIWTDSQYMVNCWSAVAEGRTIGHPDLGSWLDRLYRPEVRLCKIASHQKLEDLWGLPCWLAAGNAAADSAAKLALMDDFDFVVDRLDTAAQYLREQKDYLRLVWAYLLQLSETENQRIKAVRSASAPTDEVPTTASSSTCLAKWEQLNEGSFVTWALPPSSREVLLACSWPPWYTLPLWSWLRQLRWRRTEAVHRRVPGITYVELLLDFVVSTGVLPPDSLAASNREATAPRQWTRPFTVRMLVHNFVETIGQLERLCGYSLWGPRRKKVFSLQYLNVDNPRRGLQYRPFIRDGPTVGTLLQKVLVTDSVDSLQRFVRDYTGPVYHSEKLQKTWSSLTRSNRADLAFSLRNTRS